MEWRKTGMSEYRDSFNGDDFSDASLTDPEAFDRTYNLKDLLSKDLLGNIDQALQAIAPIEMVVMNPNGEPLFGGGFTSNEHPLISTFLAEKRPETIQKYKHESLMILVFPLFHEVEVIGYLALGRKPSVDEDLPSAALNALGALLAKLMEYQMISAYKMLLTSQLHSRVVEESFVELRQKAALLEKSEKKYRNLAADLEKEVERKAGHIKTAQARLMEQEKLAAVGRLAAGMAHEINNPIGFIKSNLGIIGEYVADLCAFAKAVETLIGTSAGQETTDSVHPGTDEIRRLHDRMDIDYIMQDAGPVIAESIEGAVRIGNIVSNLKAFSAIDQPGKTMADINACLNCVLSMLTDGLFRKILVETKYGVVPTVACRRDQLHQALLNILINAAEAAGEGGTIYITTRAVGEGKDKFVEIIIEDTGPGIPGQHLPNIFEPFFTTKTLGQGMGLGLSSAYEMIKSQGGDITAASPPGQGAVITVTLPAEKALICHD
ncbi:MAG: ATP-binding protein [Pseudomonadota bacterium]